jgi:hypothetical protein
MGAATRIFVKVQRLTESWIEVSAVVLADAKEMAAAMPGVVNVLDAQYEEPEDGNVE